MKNHAQTVKSEKQKAKTAAPRTPKVQTERPSLAGERAEGEGMVKPVPVASELEGEGSFSAARRYDLGVQRSVAKGSTAKLAADAAEALDGTEGDDLKAAERAAKLGHAQ